MITPERQGQLKSFLSGLPEHIALRVAQAVEYDRMTDGRLPHELILESLRPSLKRPAGAERTPTPLRHFCLPFEDLFTLVPRKEKQKGRILRGSVAPVWTWLGQTLIPNRTADYIREFKKCTLLARHVEAHACGAAFWAVAAEKMRDALADGAAPPALGSAAIAADAAEMAMLLSIGERVIEIQTLLPKPTPALSETLLGQLRTVYEKIEASQPQAAPYVAAIAMNRLARPWEALKLPLLLSHQTQDTMIAATDMGLVGEIILGQMEADAAVVRAERPPLFDAVVLLKSLGQFAALSSGIVKGIDIRRDGKWGQRLLKLRAEMAETMETLMARAPKEMAQALPMRSLGAGGGGPRTADLTHAIDPERLDRGMRYAKLVAGCRGIAAAASFGAAAKEADDQICQQLRSYKEDVVKELRAAAGPQRAIVEAQFDFVCALAAVLFSEEEAEFLRRRGRAARENQAA